MLLFLEPVGCFLLIDASNADRSRGGDTTFRAIGEGVEGGCTGTGVDVGSGGVGWC